MGERRMLAFDSLHLVGEVCSNIRDIVRREAFTSALTVTFKVVGQSVCNTSRKLATSIEHHRDCSPHPWPTMVELTLRKPHAKCSYFVTLVTLPV